MSCSDLYPDLFKVEKSSVEETCNKPDDKNADFVIDENGKVFECTNEAKKEYYEGFLTRPKIPRTPQF